MTLVRQYGLALFALVRKNTQELPLSLRYYERTLNSIHDSTTHLLFLARESFHFWNARIHEQNLHLRVSLPHCTNVDTMDAYPNPPFR